MLENIRKIPKTKKYIPQLVKKPLLVTLNKTFEHSAARLQLSNAKKMPSRDKIGKEDKKIKRKNVKM